MRNLKNLTDAQLTALCTEGKKEAINELITRYTSQQKSYIRRFTKRTDICDDIFQEVCIKVYEKVSSNSYHADGKFYGWMQRIAHNAIIDLFRSSSYKNTVAEADNETQINDYWMQQEYVDATSKELALEAELKNMWVSVEHLPEDQRIVIELRYKNDMSFKDIARATNVSLNTALGRERYARLNLQKMMNGYA